MLTDKEFKFYIERAIKKFQSGIINRTQFFAEVIYLGRKTIKKLSPSYPQYKLDKRKIDNIITSNEGAY